MHNSNRLEFVKSLPMNFGAIIFGFICMVNSAHVDAIIIDVKIQALVRDNLDLLGRVLVILGILKITVDWYVAQNSDRIAEEELDKVFTDKEE